MIWWLVHANWNQNWVKVFFFFFVFFLYFCPLFVQTSYRHMEHMYASHDDSGTVTSLVWYLSCCNALLLSIISKSKIRCQIGVLSSTIDDSDSIILSINPSLAARHVVKSRWSKSQLAGPSLRTLRRWWCPSLQVASECFRHRIPEALLGIRLAPTFRIRRVAGAGT